VICLDRVWAVVLRQIYLLRGSWARVVPLFAWVSVNVVLWGFTSRYFESISATGMGLLPTLLGATLLWNYFDRVMHGVTTAFLEDVWSRNFLNLFSSPLTTGEYVLGLVLTCFFTSTLGLLMMVAIAAWGFGLTWTGDIVALGGFLAITLAFGIALGIMASAMVLRLGPAAEWFVWPVPALLSPFVGVFYPQRVLPTWMQAVAKVLPPTYVFENMRAMMSGAPWSMTDLVVGLCLSAGYVVLGMLVFSAVHRSVLRSGLLARYSAEGAS